VNLVFQAVSYDEILRAVEERSWWEFEGVTARTLRDLPDKVELVDTTDGGAGAAEPSGTEPVRC
jgi:hypothetical protein